MVPPPWKHWPTRLRHALRKRLEARGLAIPDGLVISYKPGMHDQRRPPWIEARHSPDATENASVHDQHIDFRGEADEAVVLDMIERHALAMMRRDARRIALEAAGHDPRKPPRHAIEATPLNALALRLVETGAAGIDGQMICTNGQLDLNGTVTSPGGTFGIRNGTMIMPEGMGKIPETLLAAMAGRRLVEIITLPPCGDKTVDDAVAALTIQLAEDRGFTLIRIAPAAVLPIEATPANEDGRWKTMEPIPRK